MSRVYLFSTQKEGHCVDTKEGDGRGGVCRMFFSFSRNRGLCSSKVC